MRAREVPDGSRMTSYLALRSPWKSCDFTISWLMPYCSRIHISQPPGMLFAPFQKPTLVFGFRRKPSTAGARSAAKTVTPMSVAAFSTIFCEAGVGGIT